MATVTDNTNLFSDWESGAVVTSPGGGPGGGADAANFIQGAGSWSRRQSSRTNHGMYVDRGATVDLSGAGEHLCLWVMHLNRGSISNVQIYIGDATNNDLHTVPVNSTTFPLTGGWAPIWVDVSRTPENTSGTGAAENAVDINGLELDIGAVSGTTNNLYLDSSNYTTTGYELRGTTGLWSDFTSYENTNRHGVLVEANGLITVYARLTLGQDGGANSLVFDDSNFTLAFPDAPLVASTFMGITVNLDNASDNIDWTSGLIQSGNPTGATNRPDLIIAGTTGAFDATACSLVGMRIVTFTSACTFTDGSINNSGLITIDGATLDGTAVSESLATAGTAAMIWDTNSDPNGELDNMTMTKHSTVDNHALEFGSNAPLTMTLTNWTTVDYSASDGDNHSTFLFADRGSDVTWNLNIVGGTGNFTFRKVRAGDTVNINVSVSVDVKVVDSDNNPIEGARVYIQESTGPFNDDDEILRAETDASGDVSGSFSGTTPATVSLRVRKKGFIPINQTQTITGSGLNVTVTMSNDPNVE